MPMSSTPQLSVLWTGKPRASHIEPAIRSVRALSALDFELIVQDDGSASTASRGERLLQGLRRCRGEIIVVCPENARLLGAGVRAALEAFREAPHAAALLCNDLQADLVTFLFSRYQPQVAAALLRRRCLVGLGLDHPGWALDCLEFDLWQRIATGPGWQHCPAIISEQRRPARHRVAMDDIQRALEGRLGLVDALFSSDGFLANSDEALHLECAAHQLSLLREQAAGLQAAQLERVFGPSLRRLAARLATLDANRRIFDFRQPLPADARWSARAALHRILEKAGLRQPPAPVLPFERELAAPLKPARDLPLATCRLQLAAVYRRVAPIHEERGQPVEAIAMWRHAEALDDPVVDSLALQTWIKSPEARDEDLLRMQRRWVARHIPAAKPMALSLPYDGRRKIRIGYHCAFMDSETMRYMMRKVIAGHNRDEFEVYAYSPRPMPSDLAPSFDVVRDIRSTEDDPHAVRFWGNCAISDDRFVELVRSDAIDILIELTGFSPGHRFTALARRCAPLQILYINHTCTSAVPNVDYFLSDGVASPADGDAGHSEELVRLPHCLFCYDYRGSDYPPIVDPPSRERGFVTFACFGVGQKFNAALIRLWSQVLERVPGSVLRLQNHQLSKPDARRFLRSCFERFGIAPDRLLLMPGVDRQALLAAYAEIDIGLDTWPYNGGNTIAESLWHGVPVVGLYGTSFGSRYGASILSAAGCGELVGKSFDDYVAIAVGLARDPERLRSLRHRLREMCSKHGLNDSGRMARSLDDVFRRLMASRRPPDARAAPVLDGVGSTSR